MRCEGGIPMKAKKRIGTISVILVLACAVVALYWYIDRSGKEAEEPVNVVAKQILEKDLEKDYPPTPHAVAELYCGIVENIYSDKTTEKQLEELVRMELFLYDEELAAQNPYATYLNTVKDDLEVAKEKGIAFTGYIVDNFSNVKRWKKNGREYASIRIQFLLRGEDGSGASYRELTLRKDAEGDYKILGLIML